VKYFITGTDTAIGKTAITAGLLLAFAQHGRRVAGMKPVAAECSKADGYSDDAKILHEHSMEGLRHEWINPYVFTAPTAPHIAAQLENRRIVWSTISNAFEQLSTRADVVLVEGVGGWAVPLSAELMSAEIPRRLGLDVVLVAGIRLGAINHTLLTVRAIQVDGCQLSGWVANIIDPDYRYQRETIDTLKQHISAPCLAEIPWLPMATAGALLPLLSSVPFALEKAIQSG
jgi:dethiobiotin synthetase